MGDSLAATIRSLRTLIFENLMYWHGAATPKARARVENDIRALFAPQANSWR